MNDFVPPMRRRADLEKIALVTCRSELEKVKAINVELLAALKAMEDTAMRLGLSRGENDDDKWADALMAHFKAIEQARAAISKAEQS